MITFLCILALVGCGLVIASAAAKEKIPLWVGALLIGFAVLIPLAIQVFK